MTRIIRLSEVKNRTGLSRSSIYAKVNEGSFPVQIPLGLRAVGWIEQEVSDWIENQIALKRDVRQTRGDLPILKVHY